MEKIGVYLCTGCDIGKCLDIEKLKSQAEGESTVPVCNVDEAVCSEEFVSTIKGDIESEGLDAVLIAACSVRAKTDVFQFGPQVHLERVNLREQVAWCQKAGDEDTMMLAEDYLRMGIVKVQKANLPEPFLPEDMSKTILVVGGGVTGMRAALETARAGYDVVLVEKDAELGGRTKRLHRDLPRQAPYHELTEPAASKLIKEVGAHPKVTIHKSATIEKITGGPGVFKLNLKTGGSEEEIPIGAIVQATGHRPYDPARIEHLGFGKSPNIITGYDIEEMAAQGNLKKPSDGGEIRSAAFVLCAGSRDGDHLPYCSSTCCVNSLKHALYIREKYPEAKIYIFYKDMRATGNFEHFYKKVQEDPLIFMTKGDVKTVGTNGNGSVTVNVENTLLGEDLEVETDLAVLATGMVPASIKADNNVLYFDTEGDKDGAIASIIDEMAAKAFVAASVDEAKEIYGSTKMSVLCVKDEKLEQGLGEFIKQITGEEGTYTLPVVVMTKAEKLPDEVAAAGAQLLGIKKWDEEKFKNAIRNNLGILNLDYRLGTDLPDLKYGFPDSHYICFPYESRRTGIYPAGTLRQPMDTQGCEQDATGAALKAIQCVELTARGLAVHPRTLDTTYPDFFLQRCTQCKRCTEECPFGTLNEDVKGTPEPNSTRCRRCGICMGSCPERIISFKNYSVDMLGSMIKVVEVPDEEEEKPRVLVMLCENDAVPAFDMAGLHRLQYSPHIRLLPLRCLGNMNPVLVADALSAGFDGILMIGCKYGDDYQCHYMKGSELANYRMENIQETLQRLVLEPERVKVEQLSINEYGKIPEIIAEFMDTIETVGPNPYKGF
ncbi:FAD-dependent oxidoreductase [Acidobacteriota bacterium]